MYVPCILSSTAVSTWFKSMHTLFGQLERKTKSGQAAKANTARQQWMGLEMSKLSGELWRGFMCDSFNLVECYRNLQAQQLVFHPPPPPQPIQLPAVQLQKKQLAFVCTSSTPPLASPPSFRTQMTQPWQPWQPGTEIHPHLG